MFISVPFGNHVYLTRFEGVDDFRAHYVKMTQNKNVKMHLYYMGNSEYFRQYRHLAFLDTISYFHFRNFEMIPSGTFKIEGHYRL